jgi:endo-1,3-1,4-beta-glycanase ExoK
MFLNNLSGEGLFDERPTTQTSLGRFVLSPPRDRLWSRRNIKPMHMLRCVLVVVLSPGAVTLAQGSGPPGDHTESAIPTFRETFSGGTLDKTKWFIDTGRAPGNIAGINSGTLSAEHVDLSTGMLRLKLTQTVSGALATSTGAEIRSKQPFGYGTYMWVARAASTSATPRGAGSAVSGTVTDVFNFINDSETEIDFEYQGQSPSTLEMTNYSTVSHNQSTSTPVSGADSGFHEYKFVWTPGKIEFYVDGTLASIHTEHIPSAPAAVLINLWGTNSNSFGGVATAGATTYLYVSSFSYTASH